MTLTQWWGWLIVLGGGLALIVLVTLIAWFIHIMIHFLDGW